MASNNFQRKRTHGANGYQIQINIQETTSSNRTHDSRDLVRYNETIRLNPTSSEFEATSRETDLHQQLRGVPKKYCIWLTICDLSDIDFKAHFKMERITVEYIVESYRVAIRLPETEYGKRARMMWDRQCEKDIYIYLWYSGCNLSINQLARVFQIPEQVAMASIHRVCDWFISIKSEYIKWPKDEDMLESAIKFENVTEMPGAIGVMGCTHVQISEPAVNKQNYFNKYGNYSIILQTIVGPDKNFLDTSCGATGALSETQVLRQSEFFRKVCIRRIKFPEENNYLICGDSYNSSEWLIAPFMDLEQLTDSRKIFNKKHSYIEHTLNETINLLNARFERIANFPEDTSIKFVVDMIESLCVLHNICLFMEDDFEMEPEPPSSADDDSVSNENEDDDENEDEDGEEDEGGDDDSDEEDGEEEEENHQPNEVTNRLSPDELLLLPNERRRTALFNYMEENNLL